jgi:hypothetical protein
MNPLAAIEKVIMVHKAWDRLVTFEHPEAEIYIIDFGRGLSARTISLPPWCGGCANVRILWNRRPDDSDEGWLTPLIRNWILGINQDCVERYGGELKASVMGELYRFKPGKKPRKLKE